MFHYALLKVSVLTHQHSRGHPASTGYNPVPQYLTQHPTSESVIFKTPLNFFSALEFTSTPSTYPPTSRSNEARITMAKRKSDEHTDTSGPTSKDETDTETQSTTSKKPKTSSIKSEKHATTKPPTFLTIPLEIRQRIIFYDKRGDRIRNPGCGRIPAAGSGMIGSHDRPVAAA